MSRPVALSPERIKIFLDVLAEGCNVTRAAAAAGVGRQTAYDRRKRDQAFAQAWREAIALGVTALEDEAIRRGFEGYDEPVLNAEGVAVGSRRVYSDRLAILMLRGLAPDRYREVRRTENRVSVAQVVVDSSVASQRIAQMRATGDDDLDAE